VIEALFQYPGLARMCRKSRCQVIHLGFIPEDTKEKPVQKHIHTKQPESMEACLRQPCHRKTSSRSGLLHWTLCGRETEHSLHFLTIGSVRKVYCGDSLRCQERLRITSANCSSCVFKVLSNASIQRSEYQSMRLPLAEPGNLSSTKLPISFSFHHS
jgi:hypothetical protein